MLEGVIHLVQAVCVDHVCRTEVGGNARGHCSFVPFPQRGTISPYRTVSWPFTQTLWGLTLILEQLRHMIEELYMQRRRKVVSLAVQGPLKWKEAIASMFPKNNMPHHILRVLELDSPMVRVSELRTDM